MNPAITADLARPAAAARGGARLVLRLEAAAVLVGACALYARSGMGWAWFAGLFLVPDLSMLGYLAGPRIGAFAYNAAHSYLGPAILAAAGLALGGPAVALALIWAAHIGFDRMLGYGLKQAGGFGDTHLGPIGKARP